MRRNVDIEEPDRRALVVDERRAFPDRPAVVVARAAVTTESCRGAAVCPRSRERVCEVGVVGLENDLPRLPCVADDHSASR